MMMKELWNKLWNKFVNRETISYVIFGVLTTAVDWLTYKLVRWLGYSVAFSSTAAWAAAVLFAFVTNKFFVFQSFSFRPVEFFREFVSFVSCRALTGVLTVAAMVAMVDMMGWNEWVGKFLVSAMSLVLNYVFSKLFIFRNKKTAQEADD